MNNQILAEAERFAREYGHDVTVDGLRWRYYRHGEGPALLWLTGGLRRAALGFQFMSRLTEHYTMLAPDYPARLRRLDQLDAGLTAILHAASIGRVSLAGQFNGGLLAQAFLARHPERVDRLLLSSSGPGDLGRGWVLGDYIAMALIRVLPQRPVKALMLRQLGGLLPDDQRRTQAWLEAAREFVERELGRDDLISHFALAADIIRTQAITADAFRSWRGSIAVLRAAKDPTQQPRDIPRYQRLFGRELRVVEMGSAGHVAPLSDPERFAEWVNSVLDAA